MFYSVRRKRGNSQRELSGLHQNKGYRGDTGNSHSKRYPHGNGDVDVRKNVVKIWTAGFSLLIQPEGEIFSSPWGVLVTPLLYRPSLNRNLVNIAFISKSD